MKNLFFVFFLISIVSYSQTSSYNKGLKKNTLIMDEWFLKNGCENFVTNQNPVGYKKSYDELKNILSFFSLDIMEPEIDKSLIDKSVDNLNDFQNLSNSLLIEWSEINMVWRTKDKYQINWMCQKEVNLILIQKIK